MRKVWKAVHYFLKFLKFLPSSQDKIKWVNDLGHCAWVSTIASSFMQMNSLMVCLYTTINPWLSRMNSVSKPISQTYDSLAIVEVSQPKKCSSTRLYNLRTVMVGQPLWKNYKRNPLSSWSLWELLPTGHRKSNILRSCMRAALLQVTSNIRLQFFIVCSPVKLPCPILLYIY